MFNSSVTVVEDTHSRAAGVCKKCEMYISTSVSVGESAIQRLSELFDQHFKEAHNSEQQVPSQSTASRA